MEPKKIIYKIKEVKKASPTNNMNWRCNYASKPNESMTKQKKANCIVLSTTSCYWIFHIFLRKGDSRWIIFSSLPRCSLFSSCSEYYGVRNGGMTLAGRPCFTCIYYSVGYYCCFVKHGKIKTSNCMNGNCINLHYDSLAKVYLVLRARLD